MTVRKAYISRHDHKLYLDNGDLIDNLVVTNCTVDFPAPESVIFGDSVINFRPLEPSVSMDVHIVGTNSPFAEEHQPPKSVVTGPEPQPFVKLRRIRNVEP